MASTLSFSWDANRRPTAWAWACPTSDRCNPGARPGSNLPVVGVCPCRTSSTTVGRGRAGLRGMRVQPTYPAQPMDSLERVTQEVVNCRACPRLVAWRELVAAERRASFRDEVYWGRPVPGFGDPDASLLVVGLAPAAHGGNRTGRVFTGDRSGGWGFRALWRGGFAAPPKDGR